MNERVDQCMKFLNFMYKVIECSVGRFNATRCDVRSFLCFVVSATVVASYSMNVFELNFKTFAETFSFSLVYFNGCFQLLTYYRKKKSLCEYFSLCKESLFYILSNEETFTELPLTTDVISQRSQKSLVTTSKWLFIGWCFVNSTRIFGPFLIANNTKCHRKLAIAIWTPLDCTVVWQFYLIHILGCLGTFLTSFAYVSAMMLRSAIASIVTVQCQALQRYIRKIGRSERRDESSSDKSKKEYRICVKIHQKLLEQVTAIENIFSFQTFADILSSVIVLFAYSYKLAVVRTYLFLPGFIFVVLHLYYICRMGEKIQEMMIEVGLNCYQSDWYNLTPENRKTMCIIMQRSAGNKYIRGANAINSSNKTFEQVIRTSYNLFLFFSNTIASAK